MRLFASILLLASGCWAASEPEHKPLDLRAPVQDKNFYLLSLIERTPAARTAFLKDATLARIASERRAALTQAAKDCKIDLECNTAPFRWTDAQVSEAVAAAGALYQASSAVRAMVDGPLRASGMYIRFHDSQLLERAFADCMRGVNRFVELYALGKAPRYPAIDSILYDPKTDAYKRIIQHAVAILGEDQAHLDLAYSTSLRFALQVLELNDRDEAGHFEPMEKGENAAAYKRVKTVDFNRYPYTVIVVPGSGNDRPGVRLSPNGKLRDEIAAKRYKDGKAPFILVSGGYVHPNRTEFAEAMEMKRDLMTRLGVPENAIIIDPHARHTTTNMRNAARLMYRYGIPFERKALVTTDLSQSSYIEAPTFAKRCMDEMGYMPYKLLARISPFDIEFLPLAESLHADPIEPLDP